MREIETPEQLAAWLADPERPPAALQALDLTAHGETLRAGDFSGGACSCIQS